MKGSIDLQYQIELFAAGLIDDRPLSLDPPVFSRLQKVKDHHERWRTLDWRHCKEYALPEGCPRYELYMGAFSQLWRTPLPIGLDEDEYEGEDAANWHSDMNMLYLPSISRGQDTFKKVFHGDLGFRGMRDLVFDRDQELLVVVGQPRMIEL